MKPNTPEFRDLVNSLSKTKLDLPVLSNFPKREIFPQIPMERFLTGLPDSDRLILDKLEDEDLFKICSPPVNQYARKICDENFWQNRVRKRFPFAVNFKPSNLSWKKYYPYLVYYSEILKNKYNFIYKANIANSGDPKKYLEILKRAKYDRLEYAVSEKYDDLADYISHDIYGNTMDGFLTSIPK